MKLELTLCPRCLRTFMLKPNSIIHRSDYMQIEKDTCCLCQVRMGYDYVIEDINKSNVQAQKSHICDKREVVIVL